MALHPRRSLAAVSLACLLVLTACSAPDAGEDAAQPSSQEQSSKAERSDFDPKPNPDAAQVSSTDNGPVENQKEIEKSLLAEYKQQKPTLDEPLVKLDPYDAAPLSALVMFDTEEASTIKVTTGTGEDEQPISKTWDKAQKAHHIPVTGLYADRDNQVEIEATTESGEKKTSTVTITTEPLPKDMLKASVKESKPDAMEPGLTYIVPTQGHLFAVDDKADVRWYSSHPSRIVFTRLENGNYIQTTRDEGSEKYDRMLELDMLGKIYNSYRLNVEGYEEENLIHHDVIEMPNGNLLATMHEPNSKYVEDHMYEIDRKSGKTTQEVSLRDAMPDNAPDDYTGKNEEDNDWIHQNAIWFDETDESILISGRSQDVILKLSYPDGKLEWILGADEKWPKEHQDKLLKPKGDVKFPAGQHAMKIVDSPETADQDHLKDVILFDNNEVFTRGNRDESKAYSQAIRYRIDEDKGTVEQTWDYGKDRGEEFFSHIIGNVQYLYDQDNIILNSGSTVDDQSPTGTTGRVVEVDATSQDPEKVFELAVQGQSEDAVKYTYRVWRFPAYPDTKTAYQEKDGALAGL